MLKQYISSKIVQALSLLNIQDTSISVDHSSSQQFGDYTSNIAMRLAKQQKKNPIEIAQEITKHIQSDSIIEKVEVMKPGFINIWIQKNYLFNQVEQFANEKIDLTLPQNKDTKIIVEYSSPNIAKPFTIGHLRSTIIGDAVANLFEAIGYTVYRDNHLGDWGTQFGKQIYAIKAWGNEQEIENADRPVKNLVELYVKFHEEAEKNPDIEEEGRKWFKKLEDGDPEARALWQKCIDWSWKEFESIYKKLNVTFTENNGRGYGESFFEDKMNSVIDQLKAKNLLKESKGAQVVFFKDDKYPPLMIIKQDGATLYGTRDLATDYFRLEHYGKDIRIINEVGIEQSLYFNQLYEIEELLGWYKNGQRIHVKHGHYRFKDQKMSTRKGNVIWLEDVLTEAEKRAFSLTTEGAMGINSDNIEKRMNEKNNYQHTLTSQEAKDVAEKVGIGSLKWNDLKRSSAQDIVFDWDDILNMQGNSGPYMQYTYARCMSILEKAQQKKLNLNTIVEISQEEEYLMREMIKYGEIVQKAAEQYSPNILCNYLFELAQQFNLFYQKHQILKSDEDLKQYRLLLTKSVAYILKHGLHLLGIKIVQKM